MNGIKVDKLRLNDGGRHTFFWRGVGVGVGETGGLEQQLFVSKLILHLLGVKMNLKHTKKMSLGFRLVCFPIVPTITRTMRTPSGCGGGTKPFSLTKRLHFSGISEGYQELKLSFLYNLL